MSNQFYSGLTMIKIENLTINISNLSVQDDDSLDPQIPLIVRDELANTLNIIGKDSRFKDQTLIIPDNCEKYGFVQGEFDLQQLISFLADMLE